MSGADKLVMHGPVKMETKIGFKTADGSRFPLESGSAQQETTTLFHQYANGVIQHESFQFDEADVSDLHSEQFWARDDLEECPKVESGQFWMPWPTERP